MIGLLCWVSCRRKLEAKSLLAVSPAMMMRSVCGGMDGCSLNESRCRSDQMRALM